MKLTPVVQEGHPRLLLFFAGWAADATPFSAYRPAGMDYTVAYDYRDLWFDTGLLDRYRQVHVVGWSMGVWAAGQVLCALGASRRARIATTTAFAGSQRPIDEREGIPPAVFQATLCQLTPASLQKFLRRMCGSGATYRAFMQVTPRRDFAEVQEELRRIERLVEGSKMPHNRLYDTGYKPLQLSREGVADATQMALVELSEGGVSIDASRCDDEATRAGGLWCYDRAYIGTGDHIFPAANLQAHYQALGCPDVRVVDCAHYDEVLFRYLLQERWTDFNEQ